MGLLRALATELSAFGKMAVSVPLRPLFARDGFDPEAPHPTPVILVHGIFGDPTNFLALRKALVERGIRNVYTFSYLPQLDYPGLAARLAETIETICAETGAAQVDVVGHSLGGLVARYLVETRDRSRVRRLVTLGSPFLGARRAAQELAIFGAHDLVISAPDADLPRGRVVVIEDCGHCGLLFHPSVLGEVTGFLGARDADRVVPIRPAFRRAA
jgi:pimeloyl-ACP methyl ester carboxylesterase